MPTLERETIVTPVSDSGPGTFLAVILALVLVGVIGYAIYAFNHGAVLPTGVTETNTTINTPAPVMPAAPAAPAAPSGGDNQ